MTRHRTQLAAAILLVSGVLSACATVTTDPQTSSMSEPADDSHIVVIANTPGPGVNPINIDYIVSELTSRGLDTHTLPDSVPKDSIDDAIITTVHDLHADPDTADSPVTVLAIGHDSSAVWNVLADPPPGLVAAVTVNLPGEPGLDFRSGLDVATLSLNLESDTVAAGSHHEVHEAMSTAGTPHQVIVYGDAEEGAFDIESPDWHPDTAHDAAARAADWLQHRDGFTNQTMENPTHH